MGGFYTDHYGKRMTVFLFNLLAFYCWIISANVNTKWLLYVSYSMQGFFGTIAYNCVGKMNNINIHSNAMKDYEEQRTKNFVDPLCELTLSHHLAYSKVCINLQEYSSQRQHIHQRGAFSALSNP